VSQNAHEQSARQRQMHDFAGLHVTDDVGERGALKNGTADDRGRFERAAGS